MSRKYSGEVPFTFCDLAACFSEEEWKLLNEWQKELYNNVMKEIQQAFNSLGPLIATSVFSLRPKENEDLGCLKHQDLDIKTSINLFSSDVIAESEALFKRNHYLDTQDTDERKSCEGSRKVLELAFLNTEVDAGLGDYECTRREESTMCYNSDPESTSPAPPVGIDIEGETYAINIQDYQRCPTGNGNKTRKKNTVDFVKHGNKSKLCKTSSKKDDRNVNLSICDEKVPVHQMWQRSDQELSGEKIEQWQRGYNQQSPSKLHPMTPRVETSDSYNKSESMLGNYNSVPCKSNLQQSSSSYSHPENKETCQKNSPFRHTEARRVKARYACTECGKGFPAISTLIRHERIHTGERPYQCTICAKSFNQKGALQRHQILHTGERPYQCNLCGKRFNLKHNLVGHQKIHTKIQFNSKTGVQELS